MPRTLIVMAIIIVAVAFLGFVALPWFKNALGLNAKDVRVTIHSAFIDNEVGIPGVKGQVVSRIVTDMEISFPYGEAPDSISELSVRDDDEKTVDVDWGTTEPIKTDVEGRAMTKLIIHDAFFPTEFRQGKLWNKTKYLTFFRMPPIPYNAPDK